MHTKITPASYIIAWTVFLLSAVPQIISTMSTAQKVHFCLEEVYILYSTDGEMECSQINANIDNISKVCNDTCNVVNQMKCSKGKDNVNAVLIIKTNQMTFGKTKGKNLIITCDVSSLQRTVDECVTDSSETPRTTAISTIHSSEARHMTSDTTKSSSAIPQSNTSVTISSFTTLHSSPDVTTSVLCGYVHSNDMTTTPVPVSKETSYGSSVGAAIAGLFFGIVATSALCVIQHRRHGRAKKKNITAVSEYEMDSVQNQPVSTRPNVQRTDIYNEINEENHQYKILQVMPIIRGMGQSSLNSNECGVYNHLNETPPVNDDNENYDHANFSGNERDANPTGYGTIETEPNHYGKLDSEENTGNYSVLQEESFDTETKSSENYFALEKN